MVTCARPATVSVAHIPRTYPLGKALAMSASISSALQRLIDARILTPIACSAYECECNAEDHAGGTRTYMGDMEYVSLTYPDTAMYRVDHSVSGSDYSGSDYDRSNYRSLLRDYPDTFIDVWGGHDIYGLALPLTFGQCNGTCAEDVWQRDECDCVSRADSVTDILIGLTDYPVYDESDHSELIDERATDAWDQYLCADLQSTLSAMFAADVDLSAHRSDFYTLCSDRDIYAEPDGHCDVVFRGIDDTDFLIALYRITVAAGNANPETDYGYLLSPETVVNVAANGTRYGWIATRVDGYVLAINASSYPSRHNPTVVMVYRDATAEICEVRVTEHVPHMAETLAVNAYRAAILAGAARIADLLTLQANVV